MAAYVFCRMPGNYPGNYNDDIFGDAYSDMSDEEIKHGYELYDAIISSLLPNWIAWCGDELLAETGDDRIDEDFDINEILSSAWEILMSEDQESLAKKYLD